MNLDKKIEQDIILIVESLGLKVYDIDYTKSKIVIYIDKDGGSVSIEDCESVSRNVGVMLDVDDPISHAYTLEVSSPGINRHLKTKQHFESVIGHRCYVRTHSEIDSSKVFRGVLLAVEQEGIEIGFDNKKIRIDFDNIKKARVDEI